MELDFSNASTEEAYYSLMKFIFDCTKSPNVKHIVPKEWKILSDEDKAEVIQELKKIHDEKDIFVYISKK